MFVFSNSIQKAKSQYRTRPVAVGLGGRDGGQTGRARRGRAVRAITTVPRRESGLERARAGSFSLMMVVIPAGANLRERPGAWSHLSVAPTSCTIARVYHVS